ncbi:hypothetical protein [Metabacillus flavus]|nr:hypothetical protein [Metabacillus flavus]
MDILNKTEKGIYGLYTANSAWEFGSGRDMFGNKLTEEQRQNALWNGLTMGLVGGGAHIIDKGGLQKLGSKFPYSTNYVKDKLANANNTLRQIGSRIGSRTEDGFRSMRNSVNTIGTRAKDAVNQVKKRALDIEVSTPRVYSTAGGPGMPLIQWEKQKLGDMIQRMDSGENVKASNKAMYGDKFLPKKEDLDGLRKKWNVPETQTVAIGKTDIPGLEDLSFEGGSPKVRKEAGLPSLDEIYPDREIKAPYNRTIRGHAQFMDHAEEGVIASFEDSVKKAGIEPHELKGILYIHQSNPNGICNKCTKGLFDPVAIGERGIFKQLTDMYPNLNIKVSTEIDSGLPYPRDTLSFEILNGVTKDVVKIKK